MQIRLHRTWVEKRFSEPNQTFAFERTEVGGGTIEWRYEFEPQGTGTLVTESYTVLKKVNALGWFIIDTLAGLKDRQTDLQNGMTMSLERIAAILEQHSPAQSA